MYNSAVNEIKNRPLVKFNIQSHKPMVKFNYLPATNPSTSIHSFAMKHNYNAASYAVIFPAMHLQPIPLSALQNQAIIHIPRQIAPSPLKQKKKIFDERKTNNPGKPNIHITFQYNEVKTSTSPKRQQKIQVKMQPIKRKHIFQEEKIKKLKKTKIFWSRTLPADQNKGNLDAKYCNQDFIMPSQVENYVNINNLRRKEVSQYNQNSIKQNSHTYKRTPASKVSLSLQSSYIDSSVELKDMHFDPPEPFAIEQSRFFDKQESLLKQTQQITYTDLALKKTQNGFVKIPKKGHSKQIRFLQKLKTKIQELQIEGINISLCLLTLGLLILLIQAIK